MLVAVCVCVCVCELMRSVVGGGRRQGERGEAGRGEGRKRIEREGEREGGGRSSGQAITIIIIYFTQCPHSSSHCSILSSAFHQTTIEHNSKQLHCQHYFLSPHIHILYIQLHTCCTTDKTRDTRTHTVHIKV